MPVASRRTRMTNFTRRLRSSAATTLCVAVMATAAAAPNSQGNARVTTPDVSQYLTVEQPVAGFGWYILHQWPS